MSAIRELTLTSAAIRILLAIVLGGIIGIDRGMKNRPAGLRTYMLVCLGSCIVMLTSQYIYQAFNTGDPGRMGAQVVSGIGFLGAGTIIVTARNQIKGLTTAAGLWASACVGLAIGIGLYEVAILGGISVIVVLTVLHKLDYRMRNATRVVDVYVELKKKAKLIDFLHKVRNTGVEVSNIQMEHDIGTENNITFVVTLKGQKHCSHQQMLENLQNMDEVLYAEEL